MHQELSQSDCSIKRNPTKHGFATSNPNEIFVRSEIYQTVTAVGQIEFQ
jgi:hypothetical protein